MASLLATIHLKKIFFIWYFFLKYLNENTETKLVILIFQTNTPILSIRIDEILRDYVGDFFLYFFLTGPHFILSTFFYCFYR